MSGAIIVGAGLMGSWHAHAVAAFGDVIAVVDGDDARARTLAGRHGAPAFAELHDALRSAPGAVVHVCSPPALHFAQVEQALCAGHHVVCEKPVTPVLSQTLELVALAEEHGTQLTPVLQFAFQAWRDKASRVGEVISIDHAVASVGGEGLSRSARAALSWGIGWHGLSLVEHLLGPGSLRGGEWTARASAPGELRVHGESGKVGVSLSVSLAARPPRNELVLVGTEGTMRADLFHGYGALDPGGASRTDKALRPFRRASGEALAAAANLGRRTRTNEPAFPGLPSLLRAVHRAADGGPAAIPHQHLIDIATTAASFPGPVPQ